MYGENLRHNVLTIISLFYQTSENAEMQETVLLLRQQLSSLLDKSSSHPTQIVDNDVSISRNCFPEASRENGWTDRFGLSEETYVDGNTPTSVISFPSVLSQEDFKGRSTDIFINSEVALQVISPTYC